jgi:hypothetical protein
MDQSHWVLRNEFAMVEISVRDREAGPMLEIVDAENGTSITLDPLELEALTRFPHRALAPLLDPSGLSVIDRWLDANGHDHGDAAPHE